MIKWWLLAKQFPKYALVFGIVIGSTALFAFWWIFHSRPKSPAQIRDNTTELAAIRERAAKAEARIDYLFLADADLYDAGTGECLFKNWLHGDNPTRLFFDSKSRKILGQFEQGFARYTFDGTREATMMMATSPVFFDDFKRVAFAKGKNVWVADADWQNFRFANERQVTTIDSFYEQHFAENILLLTSKTLVVRNLNNLLRVNLETGNVKPMGMPLVNIAKQRSPDSRWVLGTQNGQFFCYDVDADDAKTIPIGRNGIADYQWLGNDKCVMLANRQSIALYDRLTHTITPITNLPFPCFKIAKPSPDGRFLFAAGGLGGRDGALVDLEKKTANRINGGTGIAWVSNDTYVCSRDVVDSQWRGTWCRTAGISEKKISPEPFLASANGAEHLLVLLPADLVILRTPHGLKKITASTRECLNSKFSDLKLSQLVKLQSIDSLQIRD